MRRFLFNTNDHESRHELIINCFRQKQGKQQLKRWTLRASMSVRVLALVSKLPDAQPSNHHSLRITSLMTKQRCAKKYIYPRITRITRMRRFLFNTNDHEARHKLITNLFCEGWLRRSVLHYADEESG